MFLHTLVQKSSKIDHKFIEVQRQKEILFHKSGIQILNKFENLIIFHMDAIFQIKINENKLQKILTQLTANQNNISEQLAISKDLLNQQAQSQTLIKKQLNTKFEQLDRKLTYNMKQINEQLLTQFQKLQNCIAMSSESHMEKIGKIDEIIASNVEEFNQHRSQFVEKLAKLNQDIEKKLQVKNINVETGEEDSIQKKVQNMEKILTRIAQTTELFQNKNFLYFLQSLLDKEQGSFRLLPQNLKQLKNPLHHQNSQQKAKRFNDIRRKLQQTHSKLESMQSEYTNYFYSATEGNKQNRQDTHLHYALLSTKIKQLDQKLGAVQIQNICVEKILYPTERQKKINSKMKIQYEGNTSINTIKKEQITAIVKQELQSIKNRIEQNKNQIKAKLQTIQDEIWSVNTKNASLKSIVTNLKNQFDKFQQKLKLGHLNQYLSERDQLVPKAAGLLNQFRYIQDQIQTKLNNKVDSTQFNKTVQQDNEKFKIINEQIDEKANKEQTRKAFIFFQEKIREIVTILAGMQNFSRKTAGKKLMMQCLSCDQNFLEEVQLSTKTSRPITPRNLTSRVNSSLKIRRSDNMDKNCRKSNI